MVWVNVQPLFNIFELRQVAGSVVTKLRWGGTPCNTAFPRESVSGNVLKIELYMPKLRSKVKCIVFWRHGVCIKPNLCPYVCLSVSLFFMHGHSFKLIYANFGMWHPYTLQMLIGVSERRSSSRASAERAVYTPLQMNGELRREIRNYRTATVTHQSSYVRESSAVGARCDRAP